MLRPYDPYFDAMIAVMVMVFPLVIIGVVLLSVRPGWFRAAHRLLVRLYPWLFK